MATETVIVTAQSFDQCFNASWIQLTFTNFVVAAFIMSRIGRGKAIDILYLRSILDILIQIPIIYMCTNPSNPRAIEALWKTFDYLKLLLFPLTAMYTIILIPDQSKMGKYKKQMVILTYFVWGLFWLLGLSLETDCIFSGRCDLVPKKVPRQLMGFAYFSIVFLDTLFSVASILEFVDFKNDNRSAMIQSFCKNKLFRVFVINLSGLVFYSILTYGKMDNATNEEDTIVGRYFLRLLDSYGNLMLRLYLVEFVLSKLEFTQAKDGHALSRVHPSGQRQADGRKVVLSAVAEEKSFA
ncbi:hypothetical protein BKA69DRAFT_1064398 [Paraphysoderma sedebokerense]|nr:hypothetical protein BKA69DRAFT_1064398 [Paraphysoderma sedebokerense]